MLCRAVTTATLLVAAGTSLSACSPSPAPSSSPSGSAHPPTATPLTRTAPPTPTPVPVPPGPFAVVVTNYGRTGTSYNVMLINDQAQIVAQATAELPTLQPNQTVSMPLVSASDTTVYYLNGNTTIESLSPTGATADVAQISGGSSQEIGFAVSPDGQRIAIAELSEQSDASNDTSKGYIEDLPSGANVDSLWNNSGSYAIRWPAGWDGASLIDAIGSGGRCGPAGCPGSGSTNSYHVVDPTTGDVTQTVCEAAASQTPSPGGSETYETPEGLPTQAGVACLEEVDSYNQYGQFSGAVCTFEAVSWGGQARTFTQTTVSCYGEGLPVNGCNLSPDGSRMACLSNTNGALTLVTSGGITTNTGRTYDRILGWIDASHLLVDVDSGDLGVVDPATGTVTTIAVAQAGDVEMTGTLPGSL